MSETVTLDETPEARLCRLDQLRRLPWRCVRAGLLSFPFVFVVRLLFERWGARFPPVEWTLPIAIPAAFALPMAFDLTPHRLVFSQEGVQLFYHLALWIKGGGVKWKSVRRWTLQPYRWSKNYAVASFYLSWSRRVNIHVHVSQQERVEFLLQRFGHEVRT